MEAISGIPNLMALISQEALSLDAHLRIRIWATLILADANLLVQTSEDQTSQDSMFLAAQLQTRTSKGLNLTSNIIRKRPWLLYIVFFYFLRQILFVGRSDTAYF